MTTQPMTEKRYYMEEVVYERGRHGIYDSQNNWSLCAEIYDTRETAQAILDLLNERGRETKRTGGMMDWELPGRPQYKQDGGESPRRRRNRL